MNEIKKEPRYVVFDTTDIFDYLSDDQIAAIEQIGQRISKGRAEAGKPEFNAVVVERDWPEFDQTWAAIEARITANQNLANTGGE